MSRPIIDAASSMSTIRCIDYLINFNTSSLYYTFVFHHYKEGNNDTL